jgi:hypothetical protein
MRIFQTTSRLCLSSSTQHANRRTRPSGPEIPKNQLSYAAMATPLARRKSPQLLSLEPIKTSFLVPVRPWRDRTLRSGEAFHCREFRRFQQGQPPSKGPRHGNHFAPSKPRSHLVAETERSSPLPTRTRCSLLKILNVKIDKLSLFSSMYTSSFTFFICSSVR